MQQHSIYKEQDTSARAVNATIAKAYDEVVYSPRPNSALHPDALLGLSALYGCAASGGDLLDLGCGIGVQLEQAAERMPGRLVGIDISAEAIVRARKRCARFGDRVDVRCADFLDLDPDELGQFDLIYHVGVLYVTPLQVRQRILDLIRRCLKPGGVAVISYYTGTAPSVRASIIRLVRAKDDPGAPVLARIASVRRQLDELARSVPANVPEGQLLHGVIRNLSASQDSVLFHECLGEVFDVIDTPTLAAELASGGLEFLSYLSIDHSSTLQSSRDRSLAAASADVISGGYRYAVFGKLEGGTTGVDVRTPLVNWRFDMMRTVTASGAATFANSKASINVTYSTTAAALDALAQGPRTWVELCAAANTQLDLADMETGHRQLENDLMKLWRVGLAKPTRIFSPAG